MPNKENTQFLGTIKVHLVKIRAKAKRVCKLLNQQQAISGKKNKKEIHKYEENKKVIGSDWL